MGDSLLTGIAQQFGAAVTGQDYLRSATNALTMAEIGEGLDPHHASQVLTGAMFDFLLKVSTEYRGRGRRVSLPQALWYTVNRVQIMAIQALDLLPPVEVCFRDYALAVLRAEQVANPTDPNGYRDMLIGVFVRRGILSEKDVDDLRRPQHVFVRTALCVPHDVADISASRASAYRFLDDNRAELFIPRNVDPVVADVFTAQKLNAAGQRLPKQVILQYLWREELDLAGPEFGEFDGETTTLLCGATLVLDSDGNFIHWARKPGAQPLAGRRDVVREETAAGMLRRDRHLASLKRKIEAGMVGEALGGRAGFLADSVPHLSVRRVDGSLRFELAPHLSIGHADTDGMAGGSRWQMSS